MAASRLDGTSMRRDRGQSGASSAVSITDGRAGGGGRSEPSVKKAEKPGDDRGLHAAESAGRTRGLARWT